ncbi:MAG: FAD-dependent oxidoreductase, partial [Actinobacteria bacterium]|nr:FAD-dependent oxidoreductase [Actinomycetota bacterium]
MEHRYDAIVVGAGVMGTAAAWHLARRGRSVLLLERFRIGHPNGSSHGPTRIWRLAYDHPDYVRMARASVEDWTALEEASGERLLIRTGGLDVGARAGAASEALAAAGESFEWLGPEAAAERWPLRFPAGTRVLHQPESGVCMADRTVAAQARVARE